MVLAPEEPCPGAHPGLAWESGGVCEQVCTRVSTDMPPTARLRGCPGVPVWQQAGSQGKPRHPGPNLRPALCWTLGGTTPPESGHWGPWYRLIEAFRSETVAVRTSGVTIPTGKLSPRGLKDQTERRPWGTSCHHQGHFLCPRLVPSALLGAAVGTISFALFFLCGHPCSHWPSSLLPEPLLLPPHGCLWSPHLSTARVTFLDLKSGLLSFHLKATMASRL